MRKLLVATHERFASGIMKTFKLIMGENENISEISAYVEPGFDTVSYTHLDYCISIICTKSYCDFI